MSYTLAYTGAEIDALLGKIDAIFVAEYGSTIYSEVTAAIAAGNKVIVANAGKVFVYAGTDDNSGYVFTQSGPNAAKPNATYVTLSTGNVWSTATVDLATLQQFYASLMEDTASGSIASFPDGANGVPVAELSCEIECVQDLNGYSNPWPAGGGKNLIPMTLAGIKAANTSGTWSGNAYTYNDVTFTVNTDDGGNVTGVKINGTASAQTDFILASLTDASAMILNGCPASGGTYRLIAETPDGNKVANSTADVAIPNGTNGNIYLRINASATASNALFTPMLRLSTEADATFAPYSNVCPISGYTGAEISDYAENLVSGYLPTQGYYNNSGVWENHSGFASSYPIKVSPNTHYVTSLFTKDGTRRNSLVANEVDAYGNIGGIVALQTFTTSPTTEYLIVRNFSEESTYINADNFVYQLEEGSTPTEMKPIGNHYSVSWTDHGTVYKGTAEYKGDGEWEITKTHEGVDMGDLTYTYNYAGSHHRFTTTLSGIVTGVAGTTPINAISSMYKAVSWNASWTHGDMSYSNGPSATEVTIINDNYSDAATFKTAMAGQTLVYELATPTTYTVSGPDPETLLGDNNIWSDTGDISVKYRANTALYIEKRLGE